MLNAGLKEANLLQSLCKISIEFVKPDWKTMFMAGISLGNFCGALGQCQMNLINSPTPKKGQFVVIQMNQKTEDYLSSQKLLLQLLQFLAFSEGVICQHSLYF